MRLAHTSLAITAWLLPSTVVAKFGLTTKGNTLSIDTNAGLVFDINKANGDITSLLYNGMQYQGTSKMSALNSGLGTSTVTAETIGNIIKITVVAKSLPLTHYYVARPDDPTVYMATYITGEVSPGELRWLARLRRSAVPKGWNGDVGVLDGCTAFEGKDTFKCPNGQTRCKMYTSDRFIEDQVHGVTGNNVGIWMIMPGTAYETSSGGPFMRDINSQSGDDQELYWYMNSGHVRTEPWRFGLMGPYAMRFTTGAKPSADLNPSFFSGLNIQGYVPANRRGSTAGFVTGVDPKFQKVVHWYNNASQYWTIASPADGKYTSPLMKPGTYTVKLYRGEFPVAQDTVTITAGNIATKNITSKDPTPSIIWRIGEFDGRPHELKNGDKIERMHPEDVRMGTWGGSYTVGKSTAKEFPMALFAKKGGAATVTFSIANDQVAVETVVRVGTTLSFKGGRPSVKVNNWQGSDPGAPKLIDSRGVTRGAYRGYGEMYTWKVPAGTLKEGTNTLTLGVFGSGDANFLSANYIVDALELQGPKGVDSPS
ncbi:rhamnogalacturonase B [Podospora australis]|uniref:rhamnogalacturonan endolyase n=1 Tax=Podospora australis TaxID=1536484 RepID=A0AAN6WKB8_9PEZI|nr:rhamnogalacturonase B [Podospora australis]